MKYLALIIILLCICAFARGTASGPVRSQLKCPACNKLIEEGQDGCFRMIKDKQIPIHFGCAYKRYIQPKQTELKQIQAELRKGKQ